MYNGQTLEHADPEVVPIPDSRKVTRPDENIGPVNVTLVPRPAGV